MPNTFTEEAIKEKLEEFEKEYPINYGSPYPHFVDGTPVATHIIQKMRSMMTDLLSSYKQQLIKEIEGMKKEPEGLQFAELDYDDGYNQAIEEVINLIK